MRQFFQRSLSKKPLFIFLVAISSSLLVNSAVAQRSEQSECPAENAAINEIVTISYVSLGTGLKTFSTNMKAPVHNGMRIRASSQTGLQNPRYFEGIVTRINNCRITLLVDLFRGSGSLRGARLSIAGERGRTGIRGVQGPTGPTGPSGTATPDLRNISTIGTLSYIDWFTSSTSPKQEGRLKWNNDAGTLDLGLKGANVTLQIGQEFVVRVRNTGSQAIPDGAAVASNSSGITNRDVVSARLARANSEDTSIFVLGVSTESIAVGAEGYVTAKGLVHDIDLSAFSNGNLVYLSSTTSGGFVRTMPRAPNHGVLIGVAVIGGSGGTLYVNSFDSGELSELSDIFLTNERTGDALVYDSTLRAWKNSPINWLHFASGTIGDVGNCPASTGKEPWRLLTDLNGGTYTKCDADGNSGNNNAWVWAKSTSRDMYWDFDWQPDITALDPTATYIVTSEILFSTYPGSANPVYAEIISAQQSSKAPNGPSFATTFTVRRRSQSDTWITSDIANRVKVTGTYTGAELAHGPFQLITALPNSATGPLVWTMITNYVRTAS